MFKQDILIVDNFFDNFKDIEKAFYQHEFFDREKYPLEEGETIDKHKIFEPFKYGMRQLNDKGIPCFKYIVSAKSDPEMVYRGVMTMIKDY